MVKNLKAEIERFGVSPTDIQSVIGKTEKTVGNKIKGRTPFTFPETIKIRDTFFPTLRLEYLFAANDEAS